LHERKCDIEEILNIAWIKKRKVNSPDCGGQRLRYRKRFDGVAFTLPVNSQQLSTMWRVGLARAPRREGYRPYRQPSTEEPRGLLCATLFLKGRYTTATHVDKSTAKSPTSDFCPEMRYPNLKFNSQACFCPRWKILTRLLCNRIYQHTSVASYREIQRLLHTCTQ